MGTKENDQSAERWLDAALKQYGDAEPRPGLEGRILANLQEHAEHEHQVWRWQRWPRLVAVAAIVVASGVVFWLTRPDPIPAGTVPVTSIARETSAPGAAGRAELPARGAMALTPRGLKRPTNLPRSAVIGKSDPAPPRLEQFPSPQPLSEQERILADYVAQFRREAVLVAEAQTRLERQDAMGTQMPSSEEDVTRSSEEPR